MSEPPAYGAFRSSLSPKVLDGSGSLLRVGLAFLSAAGLRVGRVSGETPIDGRTGAAPPESPGHRRRGVRAHRRGQGPSVGRGGRRARRRVGVVDLPQLRWSRRPPGAGTRPVPRALLAPPPRHTVGRCRPRRTDRVLRPQSTRPLRAGRLRSCRWRVLGRSSTTRSPKPSPATVRPSPTRPVRASAREIDDLTPSDAADLVAVIDSLTSPEAFELMTRAHARTHQQIARAWDTSLLALITTSHKRGLTPDARARGQR